MPPGCKNPPFLSCSLSCTWSAAPHGQGGHSSLPSQPQQPGARVWGAGAHPTVAPCYGHKQGATARAKDGLCPLTEECLGEDRQCSQVFQGSFGKVLSSCETPHSFSVCSTVLQGLATSRIKVTARSVKNTHPIICWAMFIIYFPGCKQSWKAQTTHPSEDSQWSLILNCFLPTNPCEGSDLPFKRVSQSSL